MVTLHAIINPETGQVEFEVQGLVGAKCTDITAVLQAGHDVEAEEFTEDYYEAQERPAYVDDEF